MTNRKHIADRLHEVTIAALSKPKNRAKGDNWREMSWIDLYLLAQDELCREVKISLQLIQAADAGGTLRPDLIEEAMGEIGDVSACLCFLLDKLDGLRG